MHLSENSPGLTPIRIRAVRNVRPMPGLFRICARLSRVFGRGGLTLCVSSVLAAATPDPRRRPLPACCPKRPMATS